MLNFINEFLLTIDSRGSDGTRPSTTDGTSITPGASNTYGSYTAVGSALTDDAYEIEIVIHTVGIAAENRMCMIDVGADPAGGSAFVSIIPDLLVGAPTPIASCRYTDFCFPLFIKSGTTLAVKAASLNATTTAIRVYIRTKHQPTRPELVRTGSFVQCFGVTAPTVAGVSITPGGASEGSYVEVGTADKNLFFLDFGYSIDDSTMATAQIDVDIAVGDATNKRVVIPNASVNTNSNEDLSKRNTGRRCLVAVGDKLYARAQHSGTADSSNTVAIYGVG